ncbi:MAG: hypothetical protein ABG776_03450 [Cyanobacteria bacterium J06555_13]
MSESTENSFDIESQNSLEAKIDPCLDRSVPTPESLFFDSGETLEEAIDQEALLEQEVQRQLSTIEDGEQVLKHLTPALETWTPSVKILDVETQKGLMYDGHRYVTETLKEKGWEIQEPYQNLGDTRLGLRIYPNKASRKILRSMGVQVNERDYPNNSWLSKLMREISDPEAMPLPKHKM